MQYLGQTYTKKVFIVSLKLKFNWSYCIWARSIWQVYPLSWPTSQRPADVGCSLKSHYLLPHRAAASSLVLQPKSEATRCPVIIENGWWPREWGLEWTLCSRRFCISRCGSVWWVFKISKKDHLSPQHLPQCSTRTVVFHSKIILRWSLRI